MDLHQVLRLAGGAMAMVLFAPMLVTSWKNKGAGQSFATWLLWGALDLILVLSIHKQDGNFWLPLGFGIGDALLVVLLLIKGRFSWGRFETVILLLVLACLIFWYLGGPKVATVATALGICVAGVPGLVALWKDPQRTVGTIWAGQFVASLLSFFGGTGMSVEERFTPGVFAFGSAVMWFAGWRRTPKSAPG